MDQNTRDPMLGHLNPLVGTWETESIHRLLPDTVIRGRATFEWLEGGHFLIWRESAEHPDFPDATTILGCSVPDHADQASAAGGSCFLQSFDSRGITRRCELAAEDGSWRFWNDVPGFSQRFTVTVSDDGNTMAGVAELNQDGTTWEEDMHVTYRRVR